MLSEYQIETVKMNDAGRLREVRELLARFGLSFDNNAEYTIAVRQYEQLVGTGSFAGEVLRNIAVDENIQGAGITSLIVSELIREQARRGRMHYFIFTKPSKAHLFASLGFNEIVRVEPYVSLMETGLGSIATYCTQVEKEAAHLPAGRAAIVINGNPFTKGHQSLIRKASLENGGVIVFVVSEDKSLFPFEHRIKLARAGVSDLPNVVVVPAGKYIVSQATFPTYFTREEDQIVAQTRLDAMLFATRIAPLTGITARYVGDEPYCPVTNAYNQAMLDILPENKIKITVVERTQAGGGIISASKVRDGIRLGDWESIRQAVPATTYDYLLSSEAKDIIEKIQSSYSRH